jgi:uncharacterized protein YidB (DUF937 family)
MGFLDSVTAKLGGQNGQEGGLASLQKMFNDNGGLDGLTSKLTSSGFGQQVQSWIGTGENKPISGADVQQAVGQNEIHQMAENAGMSDEEASDHVAQALPEMVNQATPQGELPAQDPFSKGMDAVKKMFS